MMLNKHQVKWYFEETFSDHWEEITYFLNSDTQTKKIMIEDIQEQTKGRHYKPSSTFNDKVNSGIMSGKAWRNM